MRLPVVSRARIPSIQGPRVSARMGPLRLKVPNATVNSFLKSLVILLTSLVFAGSAGASDLLDSNATNVTLKVNGGTALVEYQAHGLNRHVLAWGAINALTPESGQPQVRLNHDYSGGFKIQHR